MLYYNQERKERYITERNAEASLMKYFLPRLFKNSMSFEVQYEKDVCDFTTPEIANMLKTFSYVSVNTLLGDVSQYAIYTDWCMENGFVKDGQNHFREINRNNAEEYVNRAVMNQNVFNPKDIRRWEVRLNNMSDIALVWLLFEGLSLEEIGQIRPQDIVAVTGNITTNLNEKIKVNGMSFDRIAELNPQYMKIRNSTITTCNDRTIVVDSHISERMFDSMQETDYCMADGRVFQLFDDGHIIKPVSNGKVLKTSAFQIARRLRARLFRIAEAVGVNKLSQTTLNTSGLVWHIKQNSKEQGVSPNEYIRSADGKELLSQHRKGKVAPSTVMIQLGEFLKEKEN